MSIHIDFTINSYGKKLYDSLSFKNDTAFVYAAFLKDFSQAFLTFHDTFQVGRLPAGLYFIQVKGYYDLNTGSDTIHVDSTYALDSFFVYDDVGLYEPQASDSSDICLFPNPTSGTQNLQITTPIPKELQIDLYDLSGKKVTEIYDGLSVQGQQDFAVNLSRLPKGMYSYKIRIGEEHHSIKIVKQ